MDIYIDIVIDIDIDIYGCAKVFRFYIESWPERDSNRRRRAYRAHTLNHRPTWPNDQMCLMVYMIK